MWEKPPPTRHTHILYMKARQVVGRKGGSVQNCRRFGQHFCHPPWQCDCQGLVMRLPRAGNAIAKGRQCDCQGLALDVPAAGTRCTRGWHSMCPRPALDVPAAGTRCTRGWHSMYPRLALDVPAAGTCSFVRRNSQGPWEHNSQPLGTLFPRAGNIIPSRGELDSQEPWENYNVHFCRSHTGEIDKNAKPRPPGGEASADECGAISGSHAAKRHGRPAPQKGRPTAKWKVKSREKRGWKMG